MFAMNVREKLSNIIRHLRYTSIVKGPVLDIGSGNNPFWRADVLMERFPYDGSQRAGRIIIDRPMICGDVQDLPFTDKSFAFIHCSHVLEHVKSLERAVRELIRVGKSGYIETPSELHEYCDLKTLYHRWAISSEEGILVFREKSIL